MHSWLPEGCSVCSSLPQSPLAFCESHDFGECYVAHGDELLF